jgi:Na+/alanine symporter
MPIFVNDCVKVITSSSILFSCVFNCVGSLSIASELRFSFWIPHHASSLQLVCMILDVVLTTVVGDIATVCDVLTPLFFCVIALYETCTFLIARGGGELVAFSGASVLTVGPPSVTA